MGDVDELNSHIGLLLCELPASDMRELLIDVQHQLFNLGASCRFPALRCSGIGACCSWTNALAEHNAELPRLQEFILPAWYARLPPGPCLPHGGAPRRARRGGAAGAEAMRAAPRQYLNRLSDLLFVLARAQPAWTAASEVYWKSERLARQNATE